MEKIEKLLRAAKAALKEEKKNLRAAKAALRETEAAEAALEAAEAEYIKMHGEVDFLMHMDILSSEEFELKVKVDDLHFKVKALKKAVKWLERAI